MKRDYLLRFEINIGHGKWQWATRAFGSAKAREKTHKLIANNPSYRNFVHEMRAPTVSRERLLDLATELARYFTSGNEVPVMRAVINRKSDLFILLRECLPSWQFERAPLSETVSGES